ncbi:MAG TPA: RHS repeat domain-containing protein [Pyrinomonadaceae bacterium]|jgi:YD repeat-containing protein
MQLARRGSRRPSPVLSTWSIKYLYDDNNLLTDIYDARQVRTQFGYDGLNRLHTISYSNETTATVWCYLVYDIFGQLVAEYGGSASGGSDEL